MSITARAITKRFGAFTALDDINLDVESGDLIALLGPSGCGKTTLLRVIAGMEFPDEGAVLLDGEDMTHAHIQRREVGFVFQHYALFRHMTVFENVAFGLRSRPRRERPSEQAIRHKVHELLELVQLGWLADRFPAQLSGGQRQRIALARALAIEPRYLLLDEPFGALDASVRKELRRWLRHLHDELHVTSLFVTHDQEEAMEVASRIVVMNKGRIEQVGTPEEIYDHPATPFVSTFIGNVNVLKGHISNGRLLSGDWQLPLGEDTPSVAKGASITGYVRPHDIALLRPQATPEAAGLPRGRVHHIQPMGGTYQFEIAPLDPVELLDKSILEVELSRRDAAHLNLAVGETVAMQALTIHWYETAVSQADGDRQQEEVSAETPRRAVAT
ncbi:MULTISPECIES: sulfate/molybdate ABC transporter ATP-binding protein [Modicisalibacter]|uniref:Sulfate ABC transporter ATP-binding protein n=1 Tax=Modicisalibacter tunisiensis TaxID=390637 RepID=A0ABS7WUD7_9GAMM|nr:MULTISPECIES: sulfate ABC transporter ATP-binding protein [Modicisalibacter]MBZ9540349.1 sulfate ABC transporter ATP-binding protein [Modicisalibacter tunisiensis]MBZ9566217.1 sulfate ABC transporter ATP-binding protein [Modicisalibacter tunisiensis]